MINKVTVFIFFIAAIVYVLLRYTNIFNDSVEEFVNFFGGFLVGMLIAVVGTWISKLFSKKKTSEKE